VLNQSDIQNIGWQKLNYSEPYYFFVPRDNKTGNEYQKGFKIDEFMSIYNSGIQTKNDALSIRYTSEELDHTIQDFQDKSPDELRLKYKLKDTSGWSVKKAKESLEIKFQKIIILYRPFDFRKSILQKQSGGFIGRPRYKIAKHFLYQNLGLITVRQQSTFNFQHIFVSKFMIESGAISLQTKEWGYIFPLYLYNDDGSRIINMKKEIVDKIENIIGKVSPEDIFDYIYVVLHSPSYREKYKEFLKIDFPRVPYPKNAKSFKKLATFGAELRSLHLLESPKLNQFITTYPIVGSDIIEKLSYEKEKVFINPEQYFGNVPEVAWKFYIGGYQPAQKWLKDRKGRTLTNNDIEHYQKIIVALVETNRIMHEIDNVFN